MRVSIALILAAGLCAQDGQQGARPGWPCVPGRAVDPAYLETSESTGGQLFLLQRNEAQHMSIVMMSTYTHPATILRAVGHLSGSRDFEFPLDSGVQSILLMASLQCRKDIQLTRPDGTELTASNSTQNVDLQAARFVRVDAPEAGKWRVRISGTGLFVLSVQAKADINLGAVNYANHTVEAHTGGAISNVRFRLVDPTGDPIADLDAPEPVTPGFYRFEISPRAERFRVVMMGTNSGAWPVQRTNPTLFRAGAPK